MSDSQRKNLNEKKKKDRSEKRSKDRKKDGSASKSNRASSHQQNSSKSSKGKRDSRYRSPREMSSVCEKSVISPARKSEVELEEERLRDLALQSLLRGKAPVSSPVPPPVPLDITEPAEEEIPDALPEEEPEVDLTAYYCEPFATSVGDGCSNLRKLQEDRKLYEKWRKEKDEQHGKATRANALREMAATLLKLAEYKELKKRRMQ